MIPRYASTTLRRLLAGFPVVTVTGPRQSGKTTMVKAELAGKPYISLESPAEREFAQRAPHDFLRRFPDGAIIDEAQRAPDLLSELQTVVDADGNFVCAEWGGSRVAVYSPTGVLLQTYPFPAPHTSCPCIGGLNLDTLYCTSARAGMDAHALAANPDAVIVGGSGTAGGPGTKRASTSVSWWRDWPPG